MELELGFDPNDPETIANLAGFAQEIIKLAANRKINPLPAAFGLGIALTGIASLLNKIPDIKSDETEIRAALLAVLQDAVAGCKTNVMIL